jgi:Protein of unknown function (DUF2695)
MTSILLTPKDPRWKKFCAALSDLVIKHKCRHGYLHAEPLMREMGDIDVPGSIKFFQEHGGFCDCEILFNIMCTHDDNGEPIKDDAAVL